MSVSFYFIVHPSSDIPNSLCFTLCPMKPMVRVVKHLWNKEKYYFFQSWKNAHLSLRNVLLCLAIFLFFRLGSAIFKSNVHSPLLPPSQFSLSLLPSYLGFLLIHFCPFPLILSHTTRIESAAGIFSQPLFHNAGRARQSFNLPRVTIKLAVCACLCVCDSFARSALAWWRETGAFSCVASFLLLTRCSGFLSQSACSGSGFSQGVSHPVVVVKCLHYLSHYFFSFLSLLLHFPSS